MNFPRLSPHVDRIDAAGKPVRFVALSSNEFRQATEAEVYAFTELERLRLREAKIVAKVVELMTDGELQTKWARDTHNHAVEVLRRNLLKK